MALSGGYGLGFELGLRVALMDPLGAEEILGIVVEDQEDRDALTGEARGFLERSVS